jgi:hypothetical protein
VEQRCQEGWKGGRQREGRRGLCACLLLAYLLSACRFLLFYISARKAPFFLPSLTPFPSPPLPFVLPFPPPHTLVPFPLLFPSRFPSRVLFISSLYLLSREALLSPTLPPPSSCSTLVFAPFFFQSPARHIFPRPRSPHEGSPAKQIYYMAVRAYQDFAASDFIEGPPPPPGQPLVRRIKILDKLFPPSSSEGKDGNKNEDGSKELD